MEHHSNIVPQELLAKKTGARINYIPISKNGDLDLKTLKQYFNKNTKIVSITHMSNVLGTINPIKKISEMSHKVGAFFIVDGAQGVIPT